MNWLTQVFESVRKYIERGRLKPRRTVSNSERIISSILLLGLLLVALWVVFKGQSYDESLYALSESGFATYGSAKVKLQFPETIADGWKRGKVESYTADNLYEKINGRAELYISYDVVGLTCTSYRQANKDGDEKFIDVFVYDMGAPENAFGIYSYERVAGIGKPVKLGNDGYQAAGSIYFWKGKWYVQVVVPFEDDAMKHACEAIAKAIDTQLQGEPVSIWGLKVLSKDGLIQDSITYIKRKAFGYDFLSEVYTAQYRYAGKTLKAFVSRCSSAESARAKLSKWKNTLRKYGKVVSEKPSKGEPQFVGKVGDRFTVVFCKGSLLGGVIEASDLKIAEEFAKSLFDKLRQ
ncbi:MAG: DUF6599 family protein [Armatimonadota bacterium]|nr:hypothetical protein [Armatimonadota bacterium]MCX7778118.1 hypothetical protein [Armatimonadota bacterium]MDW8026179.1 DUF6599 family protein [Armatimonadota bacterium]